MSDAPPTADPTKPDEPKNFMEKIGAALPIGLTALATVFAGMSTGALQQAMYWKSQAAQDQSKATNQWTLAGFKVNRSLEVETAAALLLAGGAGKFEPAPNPASESEKTAAKWLSGDGPPQAHRHGAKEREGRVGLPDLPPALQDLLKLIRERASEEEVLRRAARIKIEEINKAIDAAEKVNETLTDTDWDAVVKAARKLVADARKKDRSVGPAAQAALFEMEQRRYRSEATLNQELAALYEARVRVTSAESDKHRRKSQTLFTAMLVAQIGGVVSSLALARKQKSVLWMFAATAGLVALGFGGYVLMDY